MKALSDVGYTTPTPIQQQSIPVVLNGKDLLGLARTGTGKTASFALPLLQLLHQQKSGQPAGKALILVPTRELAIQVADSFHTYGKYLPLKHLAVFGGVSQYSQVMALRGRIDILIATPGRLLDLVSQRCISLEEFNYFVLDEADRMLDMGFIHDVRRIISRLPAQRQTLFFSATMSPSIQSLANLLLKQPVMVKIETEQRTPEEIEQSLYYTQKTNKGALLLQLLKSNEMRSVLVFARTKYGADRIARMLAKAGINAKAIHGNKSQSERQSTLAAFKKGNVRVLVATDIAARGIDIEGIGYVINYELPNIPETYVHRIGRTGRAGRNGIAISFCDYDEKIYLSDIQKLIDHRIPVIKGHDFDVPLMHENEQMASASVQSEYMKRRPGKKRGRVFMQTA